MNGNKKTLKRKPDDDNIFDDYNERPAKRRKLTKNKNESTTEKKVATPKIDALKETGFDHFVKQISQWDEFGTLKKKMKITQKLKKQWQQTKNKENSMLHVPNSIAISS